MKITELILEAISFTRYQQSIKNDVNDAIAECLYDMAESMDGPEFSTLKGVENDETLFSQLIGPTLEKYLKENLLYYIEKKLTVKAREMYDVYFSQQQPKYRGKKVKSFIDPKLNSKPKRPFVKFHPITDLGRASFESGSIVISYNYFYVTIVKNLVEKIANTYFESYYHGSENQLKNLKSMFYFLKRDSSINNVIHDINDKGIIDEMIGTFLHEITHVAQGVGREKHKYRSYLEKNQEQFFASYAKDLAGQYINPELMDRLHAGSPQEIGAFVHNIALTIIKSYYFDETPLDELKYYTDIKSPYYSENTAGLRSDIIHAVRDHLTARNIRPVSRIEQEIYKRYMKMVYLEIQKYLEWLIKSKTQEASGTTN